MEHIRKTKELLLALHPVRRSAAQKEEFRRYLVKELKRAGHKATEESHGKYNGSVNVVAGDPEKAVVFLAAHYDTPARMLLPNFVSPTNPFAHVLYHFGVGALLVVAAFVLSLAVTFPLDAPQLTFPFFVIFCVAALFLSAYGSANKNNANNNTSGVLALLEMARRMGKDERVCFVFFDNNERSLLGAKSFKKKHPNAAAHALFFDFNCVGNGEEMLFMPSKYSRWDDALLAALDDAFLTDEVGSVMPRMVTQGLAYYPTDARKFKFHVAVAACTKGAFGSHIPYLNSKKDTVLREEGIALLVDGMERFFPLYFAAGEGKDE